MNYLHYNLNENVEHINKSTENDYNIGLKNRIYQLGICYTVLHSARMVQAVRR
jgi:hypothetical protein